MVVIRAHLPDFNDHNHSLRNPREGREGQSLVATWLGVTFILGS